MKKVHSEWFWSRESANTAAIRMQNKGYAAYVRYAMRANGQHDWLLEVFAE